jgi:biopolymer transport protein ExbB
MVSTLLIKGGPVMIPIVVLSVVGLAFIIDRAWALVRIRLDLARFSGRIFHYVKEGDYRRALQACERVRHPIGAMFRLGIRNRTADRKELEAMMEGEGEERIQRLERFLGALIVIIGVEPMLGFLGTIIGLINAFMAWEQAGSNITVSALAAGIYQAMITTATGLAVSIPYYIVYHLIQGRIKKHAQEMSYYGNRLIRVLARTEKVEASE